MGDESEFHGLLQQCAAVHTRELDALRLENQSLKVELDSLSKAYGLHPPTHYCNPVNDDPAAGCPSWPEGIETYVRSAPDSSNKHCAYHSENNNLFVEDGLSSCQLGGMSQRVEPMAPETSETKSLSIANYFSAHSIHTGVHIAKTTTISRGDSGLKSILSKQPSGALVKSPWQKLSKIVKSEAFDLFFCVAILVNAASMCVEAQYTSWDVGHALQYPHMNSAANEVCALCSLAISVVSWIFGFVFLIELFLRMLVFQFRWFVKPWNYLDLTLVSLWLLSATKVYSNIGFNDGLIRLIRLVRILRLLRVVRQLQGFDALFLMTTAIHGSLFTLIWAFLLLVLCQLAIALFLNQFLHYVFFSRDDVPREHKLEVFTYFGTYCRAFFTMFELTLANWPPAIRVLAEYVSEWFFAFGILYKFSLGFAVIGVINAVFMQETFRVASMDDTLMVRQKKRAARAHRKKMEDLMHEANRKSGHENVLSKDDWLQLVQNRDISTWLSSMDLRIDDAEMLFEMMAVSSPGNISLEELEKGVAKLRGAAKSLDVMIIMQELRDLRHHLTHLNIIPKLADKAQHDH